MAGIIIADGVVLAALGFTVRSVAPELARITFIASVIGGGLCVKVAKIVSVVVALHLIVVAFFFYKPPVNYFVITCLSTIFVWPVALSLSKRRRWIGIIAGLLVQLAIQRVAYHVWLAGETNIWWPLAQFLGLQSIIAFRIASD